MSKEIRIIDGEKYRANISERANNKYKYYKLNYITIAGDGYPMYHYDKRHHRLEVFLLHSTGGGGGGGGASPPEDYDFELPHDCKEIRFSEGHWPVYDKLEQKFIDQFISKSMDKNRKKKSKKL